MVFYFTGTGNSLYAAKQLEREPISIPQIMKGDELTFEDETIGIVCPVYGHEVPDMVKDFMARATFRTDYFYMILTYGNRHGGAAELAEKRCRACGIEPAYINILLMVDNWLPAFDMEEQVRLDKKIDENLAAIAADIQDRVHRIAEVTDADRTAHQQFLDRMSTQPADAWQHLLRVQDTCIGCGVCERVCPSGSIRVTHGKAVHTPGRCQTCLACVHNCPQKAIGLTVPEKNPFARFRNEHITLLELVAANRQTD